VNAVGLTPLGCAIFSGERSIVEILMNMGANADQALQQAEDLTKY
jgi:hypothetical protein